MSFTKDFVWGSATASFQIEGASREDGKSMNIWDAFCLEEGHVFDGHTGDIACDCYHRVKEDVAMMKKLGMKAYRFSVSWCRILPNGTGEVCQAGIDYYNSLIDELLASGIEPYLTLYHWDLPQVLQEKGGFLNREIADWFYEYARVCAEAFSDRVKYFFTINEPQCVTTLGYYTGEHAPGLQAGKRALFTSYYNLLRAHGMCVKALRKYGRQELIIGVASCGGTYYPATDSPEDIEAARKATFELVSDDMKTTSWNMAIALDPIYFGKYPDAVWEKYHDYMTPLSQEDIELITQPVDIHGQNIYNAVEVKAADNEMGYERVARKEGYGTTAMHWPVTPKCLYWAPKFIYERYGKPIYITENGMANNDWIAVDGGVHDGARVDFLHRYLKELRQCATDGTDVRGYFQWSLMDNFEWAFGYSQRFGIVYVDFETLERTPKDSAYFYQKVIETNGENL